MAGPFLKWAGGKAKLAPRILDLAPVGFGRYHEPFLGGGAVFFAFEAAGRAPAPVLSDANSELIRCYGAVRDDPEAVIAALRALADAYLPASNEERAAIYYRERAAAPESPAAAAARLIFLNRTCYNGLFRVNAQGQFNVPHGRYVKPRILDADGLRAAARALQGAELRCVDFADACAATNAGDFVYLDPPYHPLSATARFTAYTPGEFGRDDQERLRDAFDAMTRRGVAAVLSNSAHDVIRKLYAEYSCEEVPMSRAINSKASGRAPVPELLVHNLDRPAVQEALRTRA
jgi:DNA adenine methylase